LAVGSTGVVGGTFRRLPEGWVEGDGGCVNDRLKDGFDDKLERMYGVVGFEKFGV